MSLHRSLAAALWLLAAAGAYALAASWADDAQSGKVQPWVLVAVFWGAAAVSVAIHYLSRYLADQLAQAPVALGRHGAGPLVAQGRYALRQSRDHIARIWSARGPHWLSERRDARDALVPHLARGAEALRRIGAFYLAQPRDLLRRSWRHHTAEVEPGAAPSGRVVEIGS